MRQLILIILTALTWGSCDQENVSDPPVCFLVADPMPTYPGGFDSLRTFLKINLRCPKEAMHYGGTVYVGFTIIEDGSATDFKILRGLCDICDKNAIDALGKMPKWIPGMVKEKPVRTRMVLPVKYKLEW